MDSTLYYFPLSHFCEKAFWALDHHERPWTRARWVPGMHIPRAKRLGVAATSVPIWRVDGTLIQGSGAIIDRLDRDAPVRALTPDDPALEAKAREWEVRFDRAVGVGVRTLAYDILLEHPPLVLAMWGHEATAWERGTLRLLWPVMRRLLRRGYCPGPDVVARRDAALREAMDDTVRALGDGLYLVGGRFSRADLAAAALYCPFTNPATRAFRAQPPNPPALQAKVEALRAHPFVAWTEEIYARHRPIADPV